MINLGAFFDELEKIGFGAEQAQSLLTAAKKFRTPKAAAKLLPGGMAAGFAGLPAPSRIAQEAKALPGKLISYGVPKPVAEQAAANTAAMPIIQVALGMKQPVIVGRPSGIRSALKRLPGLEGAGESLGALSPSNKKMFNAVVTGHELTEATVPGRAGFGPMGHRSPEVMLREHNMATTLPAANSPVRDTLSQMRGAEKPALSSVGIEYGQSPRVSRHARKHLTNLIESKAEEQMKRDVLQAKAQGFL